MKRNQKIIFSIVSAITIFALLAPSVSYAILTDDITNIFTVELEATNDMTAPLLSLPSKIMIYYVFAVILLAASTAILQWEIENPEWLNLKGTMVTTGWNLTKNLADMFLLIIFVIVAFGFILRIEALQPRKSLPRLIIVALLINFSKLFVGMLIDIATIANNTVMYGHEGFLVTVMKGFLTGMYVAIVQMIWNIIGNFATAALPLAGEIRVAALIASLAWKGIFIAAAPMWAFQIVAAVALTIILTLYIFLFAARVYIIQILAILSPLAFLCLILPQTKKYWDEWFKHLIQWTFVGTILLFFLMLGLSAGNSLLPNANVLPYAFDFGSFLPILNVPKYFLFYTFLFIFLMTAFWLVDRTMPIIAVAIMGMTKSAATQTWNRVGKNVAKDLGRRANESAANFQAKDKEVKNGNVQLQGREKLAHQAKGALLTPVFGYNRIKQTTPSMEMYRYQNEERKKLGERFGDNDKGVDHMMEVLKTDKTLLKRTSAEQKLAMLRFGMEHKGGDFVNDIRNERDFGGAFDDMLQHATLHNKDLVKESIAYAPDKLDRSAFGMQLRRAVLSGDRGPKEISRMRDIYGNQAPDDEIAHKAAISIAVKKVLGNRDKIKNWNDEALHNEDLQEAIVMNAKSSDIQHIADFVGQPELNAINKKMGEIPVERMARGNAQMLRSPVTTSGVQAIYPEHPGIAAAQEVGAEANKDKKLKYINRVVNEQTAEMGRERAERGPQDTREPHTTAGNRFTDRGGGGGGGGGAQTGGGPRTPPPAGGAPAGGQPRTPPPGAAGGAGGGGFTPGAGGQRGARPEQEREIGEERTQAPRQPGTGERGAQFWPGAAGTTRSGRTTNVHPDDITSPQNAPGGQTPPNRTRGGRTSNIHSDDITP